LFSGIGGRTVGGGKRKNDRPQENLWCDRTWMKESHGGSVLYKKRKVGRMCKDECIQHVGLHGVGCKTRGWGGGGKGFGLRATCSEKPPTRRGELAVRQQLKD